MGGWTMAVQAYRPAGAACGSDVCRIPNGKYITGEY